MVLAQDFRDKVGSLEGPGCYLADSSVPTPGGLHRQVQVRAGGEVAVAISTIPADSFHKIGADFAKIMSGGSQGGTIGKQAFGEAWGKAGNDFFGDFADDQTMVKDTSPRAHFALVILIGFCGAISEGNWG